MLVCSRNPVVSISETSVSCYALTLFVKVLASFWYVWRCCKAPTWFGNSLEEDQNKLSLLECIKYWWDLHIVLQGTQIFLATLSWLLQHACRIVQKSFGCGGDQDWTRTLNTSKFAGSSKGTLWASWAAQVRALQVCDHPSWCRCVKISKGAQNSYIGLHWAFWGK